MNAKITFKNLSVLWVFGIAFGFVEAAVVVYLRQIHGAESQPMFPLGALPSGPVSAMLEVESARELASLVILLIPAYFVSTRLFDRFLAFISIFGVWDLAYYFFLYQLLGWPQTLDTLDVLFLIPNIWVAPVFCPILISLSFVMFPAAYLWITIKRIPRPFLPWQWGLLAMGGVLVFISFTLDGDYYLNGGQPRRFSWGLFYTGYLLGAVAAGSHLIQTIRKPKAKFF
ncbi:MAG: hypothetical protein OEW12_00560 [Deltaproteobacteria bacterium]|nr:hypothetical protein [Deltaproteobacteria bacterium]